MEFSYLFCETGTVAEETFPRDCQLGPPEFQLDIMHHGFDTQYQAVLAAGASKTTEIRVGTNWISLWNSRYLDIKI
jgi:hypothetical protein